MPWLPIIPGPPIIPIPCEGAATAACPLSVALDCAYATVDKKSISPKVAPVPIRRLIGSFSFRCTTRVSGSYVGYWQVVAPRRGHDALPARRPIVLRLEQQPRQACRQ